MEEAIPQGNSLAQTLLIIFVNNIVDSVKTGKPYTFAAQASIEYEKNKIHDFITEHQYGNQVQRHKDQSI